MDRTALNDRVAATAPPESAETLTAAGALGIVLLVLVPRLLYLAADGPLFDGVSRSMADELLQRGALAIEGTLTTDFEPLYPMFIAALPSSRRRRSVQGPCVRSRSSVRCSHATTP